MRCAGWRRLGRAARETKNLRVRQPLAAMQVAVPARGARARASTSCWSCCSSEVNVQGGRGRGVGRRPGAARAKPNFRALGKRFGKRTPAVAAAAAAARRRSSSAAAGGRAWMPRSTGRWTAGCTRHLARGRTGGARGGQRLAGAERRPVRGGARPGAQPMSSAREGLAREVVNRVQRLRKDAGYEYTTRIRLWVTARRRC